VEPASLFLVIQWQVRRENIPVGAAGQGRAFARSSNSNAISWQPKELGIVLSAQNFHAQA
jgi:hypothetical protein